MCGQGGFPLVTMETRWALRGRCQQHRNQDESGDDSSSGGGADPAAVAPVGAPSLPPVPGLGRTRGQSPKLCPDFILNILCCHVKLCVQKDSHLKNFKIRNAKRGLLFLQVLIN